MRKPVVSAIAAIGKDRVLGMGNKLLWHIPDDLKRFKEKTMGHPVIFGRKTFESIIGYLGKPLPGRTNIVVTRDVSGFLQTHQGVALMGLVIARSSIEEAIKKAKKLDGEEIFIGGGAQIYEAALPYTDRLYLTIIDDEKEGDAYFPEYESQFTKRVFDEERESNNVRYRWLDLERSSVLFKARP